MMSVNTNNFDTNNWGEFVHKKALNDVIQQINQVDAEQNNAISKISDLANQANQNAVNALKIAQLASEAATDADNTANALKNDVDSLAQKVNDLENSKVQPLTTNIHGTNKTVDYINIDDDNHKITLGNSTENDLIYITIPGMVVDLPDGE